MKDMMPNATRGQRLVVWIVLCYGMILIIVSMVIIIGSLADNRIIGALSAQAEASRADGAY
jgi:hypothetical protein